MINISINQRIGHLTVIDIIEHHRTKSYICRCDCSNEIEVSHQDLRRKNKVSCGCKKRTTAEEKIGMVFGKLIIESIHSGTHHKNRKFVFRCECGNERIATLAAVKSGNMCCLTCNLLDLTCHQFHNLTVIKRHGYRVTKNNKHIEWECKCICGEIVYRTTHTLKRSQFSQCDKCNYQRELAKSDGFQEIRRMRWTSIQSHARLRKIEFDITIEYAWELWLKQNRKCALSGITLEFEKTKKDWQKGNYTASFDRIDSTKGYVENNVQWVHKKINNMKMNLNETDFVYFCKMVAKYHEN